MRLYRTVGGLFTTALLTGVVVLVLVYGIQYAVRKETSAITGTVTAPCIELRNAVARVLSMEGEELVTEELDDPSPRNYECVTYFFITDVPKEQDVRLVIGPVSTELPVGGRRSHLELR